MTFLSITTLLAILGGVWLIAICRQRDRQRLPPGPKPLPVVGNMFDFPKERAYAGYLSLAQKYGDLISLNALGNVVVVINSHKVAKDLLEKKTNASSGRPFVAFAELSGWTRNNVSWMPYDQNWHGRRRLMDPELRPASIIAYRSTQRDHALSAIQGILENPDQLLDTLRQYTASVVLSVVYGFDIAEVGNKFIQIAEEMNSYSHYLLPSKLIVNQIPILRHLPAWFPGCQDFHALGEAARKATVDTMELPFSLVKKGMRDGTARSSLVGQALRQLQEEANEENEQEERALIEGFGIIYAGNVDTTSRTISGLILALCLHPAAQRRAQEEIEQVVGRDRLPDFSDRPNLPFVDAICQEIHRWRPTLPQGGPHSSTEDIVYDGYLIPKGATIIANTWAILHDPRAYQDPDLFKPERFITADNKFIDDPAVSSAFGWGKRKCPGRHFADTTMWIFMVTFLATCEVSNARDKRGGNIPQDVQYIDSLISHPPDFTFTVVPRHEKAEEMLRAEHAAA